MTHVLVFYNVADKAEFIKIRKEDIDSFDQFMSRTYGSHYARTKVIEQNI